jgi:hypothetical protein
MILEILLGFFGFLGVGWMYSGSTGTGLALLFGFLAWLIIICCPVAVLTGGIGLCCVLPINIVVPILSGISLNSYTKQHPELFGGYYPANAPPTPQPSPVVQQSVAPAIQAAPVFQPSSRPAPLPSEKTCPRCRVTNPIEQEFCGNCGTPLAQTYQKSFNIQFRAVAISAGIGTVVMVVIGLFSGIVGIFYTNSVTSSIGQTPSTSLLWASALICLFACLLTLLIVGGVGAGYSFLHSQRSVVTAKDGVIGGALSAVIVTTLSSLINGVMNFVLIFLFSPSTATFYSSTGVGSLLIGLLIGFFISIVEGIFLGAIGGALGAALIGHRQTVYQ